MNVEPESPLMDTDEAHLEVGDRHVPVKESVSEWEPKSRAKTYLCSKNLLIALLLLQFLRCFTSGGPPASLQGNLKATSQHSALKNIKPSSTEAELLNS